MIGAVLMPIWATLPTALLIAAALGWYWRRLGGPSVPATRRRVRRMSLLTMIVTLGMLVVALSVVDPAINHNVWILSWVAVLLLLLVVILTALLDVWNTLRLEQTVRSREARQAADALARALRERRAAEQQDGAPRDPNSEPPHDRDDPNGDEGREGSSP